MSKTDHFLLVSRRSEMSMERTPRKSPRTFRDVCLSTIAVYFGATSSRIRNLEKATSRSTTIAETCHQQWIPDACKLRHAELLLLQSTRDEWSIGIYLHTVCIFIVNLWRHGSSFLLRWLRLSALCRKIRSHRWNNEENSWDDAETVSSSSIDQISFSKPTLERSDASQFFHEAELTSLRRCGVHLSLTINVVSSSSTVMVNETLPSIFLKHINRDVNWLEHNNVRAWEKFLSSSSVIQFFRSGVVILLSIDIRLWRSNN